VKCQKSVCFSCSLVRPWVAHKQYVTVYVYNPLHLFSTQVSGSTEKRHLQWCAAQTARWRNPRDASQQGSCCHKQALKATVCTAACKLIGP
jgi:hypothetical protein